MAEENRKSNGMFSEVVKGLAAIVGVGAITLALNGCDNYKDKGRDNSPLPTPLSLPTTTSIEYSPDNRTLEIMKKYYGDSRQIYVDNYREVDPRKFSDFDKDLLKTFHNAPQTMKPKEKESALRYFIANHTWVFEKYQEELGIKGNINDLSTEEIVSQTSFDSIVKAIGSRKDKLDAQADAFYLTFYSQGEIPYSLERKDEK